MKIKGEYRDILSSDGTAIMDTCWKSNVIVEDYGRFLAALMKKDFKEKVGIDYMAVGSGSGEDSTVFREKVIKFIDECLYLFSIDAGFEDDLNKGIISEKLKDKFKTERFPLSKDVNVTKKRDDKWRITDKEKEKIYIVKKEDGKLNIGLGPLEVGEKGKEGYYWVWAKEIEDSDIKYLNPEDEEVDTVTNRLKIDVTFEKEEPSGNDLEFREFALLGIDKNTDDTFATNMMFFINYVDHGVITKDEKMELTRSIKLKFPIEENEEEVVS